MAVRFSDYSGDAPSRAPRCAGRLVRLALVWIALAAGSPACRAVNIVLNYEFDNYVNGPNFFGAGNPSGPAAGAQAKAAVEAAASFFSGILNDTLAKIQTPAPFHSTTGSTITWNWSPSFPDPSTGAEVSVPDPTIALNEYRIYVGARSLPGNTLGQGGPGGIANVGHSGGSLAPGEVNTVNQTTNAFQSAVFDRGEPTGFDAWGGALTFDLDAGTVWHYNHLTPPTAGENDFYSVAIHELAHALGFGDFVSSDWSNLATGAFFTGDAAKAEYGSMPPLKSPPRDHWLTGTMSRVYGTNVVQEASMDPELTTGQRKYFTRLDAAALTDIGWIVATPFNPADFNHDTAVDGGDLMAWKGAFGSTNAADADGDGDSDGADFLTWQRQRGMPSAAMLGTGVPEPGAAVLTAIAAGLLARRRRRR